jgi:hypothetical protein
MNPNPKNTQPVKSGGRFAGLSVVLLTLVALTAGWWLKSNVENRSRPFESGNITAQIPADWLMLQPDKNEVLHITDRTSSGFGTTYLIQVKPIPADAQADEVASLVTLDRGNTLTGYRVLEQQTVLVQGHTAIQIEYVYVESAANLNHAVLPAVVRGLDYVFINAGQAEIISYRADESVYATDLGRFHRFLASVKF